MIGAMPAVAVRHERRRQEKRTRRPSQLHLGGIWLPPYSPTPSPSPQVGVISPGSDGSGLPEYYMCGKVSTLSAAVCSLLLGAVILVVGLVQLSPGAEAADHRFPLLLTGGTLLCLGLVLTAMRCCCLQFATRRLPVAAEIPATRLGVSSIEGLVASDPHGTPSEVAALLRPSGVQDNSSSDT